MVKLGEKLRNFSSKSAKKRWEEKGGEKRFKTAKNFTVHTIRYLKVACWGAMERDHFKKHCRDTLLEDASF